VGRSSTFAGIPDEIKEESPCSRSAAPVKTTAWLESEMRNERPARHKKSYGLPELGRLARKECRGPSRIDQHDIAHIASQGLFVMGHCGLAGDLKDRDVVVRAIEANVPLRPLDSLSIRTNLGCR
jgi:hypothetical protein